jgi:hypothetical protein
MTETIDWDRLISFCGYGPQYTPDVLFFGGLEERARGDQNQLLANLFVRSKFAAIEDIFEAHEKFGIAGCHNPFGPQGKRVNVWHFATKFALALAGGNRWREIGAIEGFWRRKLGRKDGTTFLMDWFPIPRDSTSDPVADCPYTEEQIQQMRMQSLTGNFAVHQPKTVIAYGKSAKQRIGDLLRIGEDGWRLISGASQDPASVASIGSMRVALVGHPSNGAF